MARQFATKIVCEYARMWPRWILEKKEFCDEIERLLKRPGVYILYRDEHPYYVGQARNLFKRLSGRANNPQSRHFHFWNFFSAYAVTGARYLDELESILITSMATVTANRANPKIKPIALSNALWKQIREEHHHQRTQP